MLLLKRFRAPLNHIVLSICLVTVGSVVPAVGESDPTATATARPPFVESGRVQDPSIGFSFALPAGWQLDGRSGSGNLLLTHQATSATFSVQLKEKAMALATEFKVLKLAVAVLGGEWTKVRERWTKVGELRAGELESRRDHGDGTIAHEWNLVCVRKGQALLLWLSIPEAETRAGRSDLDQILSSFKWSNK